MANTPTTDKLEITIATRTVIRVALVIVGIFILLLAINQAKSAIILILTAFFLALALNAPVQWVEQHLPGSLRGSRTAATAVSFVFVVLLLAGFLASVVPPLVSQTVSFTNNIPSLIEDSRRDDSSIGQFVQRYNLDEQITKASGDLSGRLNKLGSSAFSTVSKVGSSIVALLTVLVLTFMMLIEGRSWGRIVMRSLSKSRQTHAHELAEDMYRVVRGYVNGQVFLAALAAGFIVIPLLILGVSYPIALMVIIFICGLIPLVGHTIGAAIVSVVALFTSPLAAVIVLAYYILYQQIENYVIQPRVQANSTNMSPLLVFGSVIIGVNVGGLLGGLVAIPVAGCLRILLIDHFKRHSVISDSQAKKSITP